VPIENVLSTVFSIILGWCKKWVAFLVLCSIVYDVSLSRKRNNYN
jgi:hypothetical protein